MLLVVVVHHDVVTFLWDRVGVATDATRERGGSPDARRLDRRRCLLAAMTLEEKVAQLHGAGQMRGTVNRRLDVPAFETADGPHGIGEAVWRYLYRHTDRATAFPVAIAIAASWDPELAARIGGAIAVEARAKGRNWLLAPALDVVRDPRAGRVFEAYGEDPVLAARLGVAFVRGAQAQGVIATPKHFVCHHHETDRADIDMRVGERALRELYLPPFEAAVREGHALSIMAASHSSTACTAPSTSGCCARAARGVGLHGVVVSDWDATTIDRRLDPRRPRRRDAEGAPLRRPLAGRGRGRPRRRVAGRRGGAARPRRSSSRPGSSRRPHGARRHPRRHRRAPRSSRSRRRASRSSCSRTATTFLPLGRGERSDASR